MSEFYDRHGAPITSLLAWADKFETPSYRRIAETTLPDGTWISTVWLGRNHAFGDGPPLIFETMVFRSPDDLTHLDSERYSTEAEAVAGHQRMVDTWAHREADRTEGD